MNEFNPLDFIRSQFSWLKRSADNEPGGASSKKLTGFYCFLLVGFCVIVYLVYGFIYKNFDLLIPIITLLLTAGMAALKISSDEKVKLKDKLNTDGNGTGEDKSAGMG